MALRDIKILPSTVLRRKAHKVTAFGPELQALIDDMVETMRAAPGVGLAAPQVDVSLRVIVVEFGSEEDEEVPKKLYTLVNPEIVRPSEEMVVATEACLSIPGFVGDVERHEGLTVKALNRFGKPQRVKAEGWLARIFQHEIDHINGVVFPDRATRVWKPEPDEEQDLA